MKENNSDIFQALADPSRLQILHLLSRQSMTITALASNFEMSRPAVSKHIKILNTSGFLEIEDRGRERYCFLSREGFNKMHDWLAYYDNFWREHIGKLQDLLDKPEN